MIAIPSTVRVFLATEPQDFRKAIDGLAAIVGAHLQRDPMTGDVFVFHNRRRTALKVLYWDHGGFVLVYNHRGSYCVSYDSINHLDSPARLLAGHAIG